MWTVPAEFADAIKSGRPIYGEPWRFKTAAEYAQDDAALMRKQRQRRRRKRLESRWNAKAKRLERQEANGAIRRMD